MFEHKNENKKKIRETYMENVDKKKRKSTYMKFHAVNWIHKASIQREAHILSDFKQIKVNFP